MEAAAQAPRRSGWYYGWNIIAVSVLAQIAANGLAINALSLFLRDWSSALKTPISSLQLAMAPLALVTAVLAPIIGAQADKRPARGLIAAGLVIVILFDLAISFMTATWQFVALYSLVLPVGVLLSTTLVANALVSRWFVKRIGLALGLTAFGVGMAGVLLPPIVAAALSAIGWRALWRIAAALIAVVVLPAVFVVLRERPTEREGLHYVAGAAAGGHGHGGGTLGWRDVLGRRNFWLLVAVFLPILATYGGGAYNLAPIAASHGLSRQTAGILLSVLSLAQVAATLVLGLLSDRFGNRLPFAGLAVVAAAGAGLVAVSHGLIGLAVGFALIGAGGGLWTLVAATVALEFGAANVGRAFGTLMLVLPVNALAPFALARTHETTGSYAPALLTLAVLALVGGGLGLLMREKRGGHATPAEREAALEDAAVPIV